MVNTPLFFGLTHVGQVFSVGWAEKIGKCSVFDFDKLKLKDFKNSNLTSEEPGLKRYFKKNIKKINFVKTVNEIKYFKNVFLTIDIPLSLNGTIPRATAST